MACGSKRQLALYAGVLSEGTVATWFQISDGHRYEGEWDSKGKSALYIAEDANGDDVTDDILVGIVTGAAISYGIADHAGSIIFNEDDLERVRSVLGFERACRLLAAAAQM